MEPVPGLAWVTGQMLTEGTSSRGWRSISEEAEALGMALTGFASAEAHGLGVDALAGDWERALSWTSELLLDSRFPEERCELVCRQAASDLLSQLDQPEVRTSWCFLSQLYGQHPLGRPLQGDLVNLKAITSSSCASFHRRAMRWGVVVAVAGAVPEAKVRRRVEELFSSLDRPADEAPPPAVPVPGDLRRRVALPASRQAQLLLGHLTVARRHPDFAALELLGVILGSGTGLAGRIPTRLREREGLAYAAQAACVAAAGLDPGHLTIYAGTAPDQVTRVEMAARQELERLIVGGVGGDEFEEARSYLSGREPFRRETTGQWAGLLCQAAVYGLPLHRPGWYVRGLERLDRAAVEAAARRHLRPEEIRVTVGMPQAEAHQGVRSRE